MKRTISAIALLSISSALLAKESIQQLPATVVTADLWESELQQTTASVTVLDEDVIDSNGVQHVEDIINSIPNLTWTGGTSRPRYIQIRGIGENSQFEGETPDSTVRFLIDDVDLTGLGTVGNLFDVQQVEVLRGPQAGAFGANAAGGVVKIVTNDPTSYWTGQAEATVGNDDLRAGGIAIGGPLLESDPEKLTFRLSAHQLVQNGFRDNQFLGRDDTNERNELTTRLKLRWLVNENLQFDAQVFYANVDNGYDEFSLNNDRTDTFSDQPGRDEQESIGASLRTTWDGLDKATLSTVTAFSDTDSFYSYDSDWSNPIAHDPNVSPNYRAALETDRERSVFSQEIKFDSKEKTNALGIIDRWTLGAYYQYFDEKTDVFYEENFSSFLEDANVTSDYKRELFSIFAQIGHDFSVQTRLIIGLRIEHNSVDFSSNTENNYYSSLLLGENESDETDTLFGGKITLEHDLNDAHMAFASVARGYKAGGANSGSFRFPFDSDTFEDETLYNFEIGLRSEWLDGKLTSSFTAFYLYREDAQFRDSAGSGGFFRYLTVNGEDAHHYGIEADMIWQIDEYWAVYANLGLLETDRDSYITTTSDEDFDESLDANDDDDPLAVRIGERELANAPSYSYALGVRYDNTNGFFANAEVTGKDEYFESNSHSDKRNSFAVVNASMGYRYENWTFTLWSKNLFDEQYEERVFFFNNGEGEQRYEAPAAPRTFGITAKYSW
jgi:outer membrane receptor protein involved in Fe transport